MDDEQLDRYSRQLLLNEFDMEGQKRLKKAHIMVVGVGGLGNIAATTLVGAGVGSLSIWDGDNIELSNLPRQPLYNTLDVGKDKAKTAKTNLLASNPDCDIITYPRLETFTQGHGCAEQCDLILDCSDNVATRRLVNEIAVKSGKPLIAGAAIRFEGQLMTFLNQGGGCYECLSTQMAIADVACRDVGILNTQVLLIGLLQAHVAIKHIIGLQPLLDGHLMLMDGKRDQFQHFTIAKSAGCKIC